MTSIDHENEALNDIANKPDVSKKPASSEQMPAKEPLQVKIADTETAEPDELEQSAGKVLSNAIDEIRAMSGAEKDKDFSNLLAEASAGLFSAIRVMSGKSWMRYVLAFSVIGVSLIPAGLKFMAAKKEKEEQKQ